MGKILNFGLKASIFAEINDLFVTGSTSQKLISESNQS